MRASWHDLCDHQTRLQMISSPGFMPPILDPTVPQSRVQAACAAGAGELRLTIRTRAGQKAPSRCCRTPRGAR